MKKIYSIRDKPVLNHCTDNNHTINCDGITILDFESNYYRRNISEKLNIKIQKKPINKKTDTRYVNSSYKAVLHKASRVLK